MQKNIKEFKGHKIWFDQMSKKEFIEDHQTTFLKFLDETVQIKE
jgi:DNA phosphorothioation-dependent restriction protein DptG